MRKQHLTMLTIGTLLLFPGSLQAKDPLPLTIVPYSAGIAAHYNSYAYNPAYTDKTFDSVAQAKFSLVRFVPDWQNIEKAQGVYDFTTVDWLSSQFTSRGLRPVLTLGLNNPLYKVNCRIHTSEQRTAFISFVQAMVQHYKGRKFIWEIWNEPNIPSFWKRAQGETLPLKEQVAEYLALVDSVVPVIRAADPDALIIGPGAANYNTPWMKEALQQGLLARLDGLSVHPYQGKERPELVITQHRQVQSWIPPADKNKPVFFTEWGYSTGAGPRSVSTERQAAYAQRQYMLSLLLNVKGNFVYSLTDASLGVPCQSPDGCYGVFSKATGSPKPIYTALKELTDTLTGFQFVQRITHSDPTVYILEFKNNSGKVKYAIWCSTNDKQLEITLPRQRVVTINNTVQIF